MQAGTQIGGALDSAFPGLSHVGADRAFAGMAFDKMRSASVKPAARQAPEAQRHVQHAGVENVSRSFHAHREPQQFTRSGPPRGKSFSRLKDGSFLMRLPPLWVVRTCRPLLRRLS